MTHIRWRGIMFLMLLLLNSVIISHAQQEERLQVLASHSILGDVAANVAGDAADVTTLMPRNADPHSFTPTPRDMTRVADADVVLVNGALFEEGLLEAIANADADVTTVIASACVPMLATDDTHDDDDHSDDEHHDDEHHDDEHHDDDHSDDEHHDNEADSTLSEQCEEHADTIAAVYGDMTMPTYASTDRLYAIDCGDGHGDEHEEEHDDHSDETDDDHADEHDDHAHGACDPHVWLVPSNVMYWTLLIRDTLIERDPTNETLYTANADAYLQQLADLDTDTIRPMLDTLAADERVLVTNHEAFGYFGAAYDFEVVDTIIRGGGTMGDPSAAEVASVIDIMRERGVPALFTETTAGSDIAQQIATETGASLALLYSGSLGEADSPAGTYLDFMRYNVETIVEALSSN